jgi:uncharacterized protein
MKSEVIIQKTHDFIQQKFTAEGSGHDYWHMYRVWQLAKHIAATEKGVDMFTLELAALLHDIADWKFHDGDEQAGPRAAREWLASLAVDETVIKHIEDIIINVSFKGAGVKTKLATIEGKIVHDADKLDAIGAIGIGRTFAYGGAKGRPMHDPARSPQHHKTFEAYKNNDGPTINHFYEKLLLLKDRMFTQTGKKMAQHRHKIMEDFLQEFYDEWDGKK